MAGNDRRESARIVKPEDEDAPLVPALQPTAKPAKTEKSDGRPAFEPNRWYHRKTLQKRLKVGNQTWARWISAGLTTFKPGTKEELVFTDEKIDRILRMSPSELPAAYESPHKAKNASRKKGS